jgi:hypothetical protein
MIGWAVDSGGDDIIGEIFDDAEKIFLGTRGDQKIRSAGYHSGQLAAGKFTP